MSTESRIARAGAAADAVINPDCDTVGVRVKDRATHLAAAEAAAAAQAAVAVIAALRAEMEREPETAGGSCSPEGCHR
jgi:hypothetical protein